MDPHDDFDKHDRQADLERELVGANEMKAKFEQSAAEGWTKYRELNSALRKVRERFASYRLQRPRSFNGEMADEIALEREDKLMESFLCDLDAITTGEISGLEQLLDDYRACEDNDRGDEWYWLDEIEKRIGRERYRRIMFPVKSGS